MKRLMTVLLALLSISILAQPQSIAAENMTTSVLCDSTQGSNYLRAYVLYSTPGPLIDETWGHAALRIVCEDQQIDNAYTSIPVGEISEQLGTFIAGHCQSKVDIITTASYVERYATQGRGVNAYELNLPIEVKQQLWLQMEERLNQSPQQFDFVRKACAQTVFRWVTSAIDSDSLQYGRWAPKFDNNIKELLKDGIPNPWVLLIADGVMGGETTSTDLSHEDRVILPYDLVEVLQRATAYGQPLLTHEPEVLLVQTRPEPERTSQIAPTICMLVWLLLMMITLFTPNRWIQYFGWSIQFILGLFFAYLVLISDMPGTEWNWLLIPLNPLPVLCWHWRRYWAFPFGIICLVWIVTLMLSPHLVFTLPWYFFVGGVACASFGLHRRSRRHRK